MATRPLGYATVEDLALQLDLVAFKDKDVERANRALRHAESLITMQTGGRVFLPVVAALADDLATDDEAVVLTAAADRFLDTDLLYIDDELLSVGARQKTDGGVTYTVGTRGVGGTTVAEHSADALVYTARQYTPTKGLLFTDELLAFHKVWYVPPGVSSAWTAANEEYLYLFPDVIPAAGVRSDAGSFTDGNRYCVAGTWGYSYEVPETISEYTVRIAEVEWRKRGFAGNMLTAQSVDGVSLKFRDLEAIPADVREGLKMWRRVRV
jgi:hypothetical protein